MAPLRRGHRAFRDDASIGRTRGAPLRTVQPGAVSSAGVCGRYTNTAGVQELNERFKVPFPGDAGTHRYNIAPTEEVLAIVAPKGTPQAELMWMFRTTMATPILPLYVRCYAPSSNGKPGARHS